MAEFENMMNEEEVIERYDGEIVDPNESYDETPGKTGMSFGVKLGLGIAGALLTAGAVTVIAKKDEIADWHEKKQLERIAKRSAKDLEKADRIAQKQKERAEKKAKEQEELNKAKEEAK